MEQYYDYNHKLKVKDELFTPIHGVRLTHGLFKKIFDNNIEYNLTQLDMDRMRYWFDVKAGREPKAERYEGHFEDNLKGQTASQYLMCAGNVLRWEEIPRVREGLREVLDFLEDSQETNGFLMPIDKSDFAYREYPHYVRIWLTYALIAAANSGEKRAFRMLRLWQDWFNRCPDLPVIKYLELAFQGVVASPLVYNTEIGVEEDMEITIEHYEEPWRLAQFIENEPWAVKTRRQHGKEPHPHGSELEAFEGYLDLYRYTGKPYYLNAVKKCMRQYKGDWQHPGGGIIMCERFNGADQGHRLIYYNKAMRYNELCATAFWMGLNQRLHRLFPDEESYVFELEQSLYNIACAAQVGTENIINFMILDGYKLRSGTPNNCCCGVGTKIFASLPEYLFTMNKSTISCDIYASAELDWQTEHGNVKVTEETEYPYDSKVKLTIEPEIPHEFTLRVRIPHYATNDVDVYINGEKFATGKTGSYLPIFRQWNAGDTVEFEIPFGFAMHAYEGEHDVEGYARKAFTYGPILLAIRGEKNHENGTVVEGAPEEFIEKLKPNGRPLCFCIEGLDGYTAEPFFDFQEGEFVCFPLFKK